MVDAGRILLAVGIVLALVGGALMLSGRLHLPGDLTFRGGNLTVFVPIATSIILSIVLTIALNVLLRRR